MKLKITKERDCCEDQDLKAVEGCEKHNFNVPKLMFCVHCGARHAFEKYMDAAGSMDYRYRKVKERL